MIQLCNHPDAGDFVLCGWRYGAQPYSFPMENGALAGPGPEETNAFALLPEDVYFSENSRGFLRPLDLHNAARGFLDRSDIKISARTDRKPTQRRTLRIMTYNIHSCIGMYGKVSPQRIARAIAQKAPDIVALQELDVGRSRTNGVNQASLISQLLNMDIHFLPTVRLEKGRYGNAILTYFPMRLVKAGKLPGLPGKTHLEPRGAIWTAIQVNGTDIQFFNTHLGLRAKERQVQAQALLGKEWLSHPDCRGPVILSGDFNAIPFSAAWRRIRRCLPGAQLTLNRHRPKKTLFGRYPLVRIDHVFIDPGIKVAKIEVPNTELTRVASDHLPLVVDVDISRS